MSTFERDFVELGWWVAVHRAVEDNFALLRTAAHLARWWRAF